MADILLSALLPAVMEKATDYVLHQFGAMWGIQDMLEKLKRILLAIQDRLVDAEERQVREEGVKSWLAALKDAAYEADDILDEFNVEAMRRKAEIQVDMREKVRSFFSFNNPVSFRFKMGRKLNDIIDKIEKIVDEGNKFGFTVKTQPQIRDRPQTHSYVDESDVTGRDADKEKMVKLLLDQDRNQNIAVVSIVGMGGLGKTTLAQLIYKDERVEKHFQLRIWVCVSDEFDLEKLAKQIIASATKKECELSTMELLQSRLREVVGGKRYLLVLDDVWNEDQEKWDRLKTLLGTGGGGSRIIVTTRSERVSQIMGALAPYHPPHLTEDDSWTLFRKRAFEDGEEEPQDLVSIGKQIVKKCGGLPLAIKTLGGSMHSTRQEREWLSVRDSEIWEIQGGEDGILPALRLSYKHLPSHLKQCFAFCAMFPKDYEMQKDMLIQLWMANGFVPSDGRKELEDKGHEIFDELAWRSFFQDIKETKYPPWRVPTNYITTCKIHDLMHDLARSIMGNECVSIQDPASLEDLSIKTRHLYISVHFESDISRILNNSPNIRTLMGDGAMVIGGLSKHRSLRALHLYGGDIGKLSNSIAILKHLRYLDLSRASIQALPEAISTLFSLQTLRLSDCWNLRKLPEDMIRNMSSLRHLYIDGCEWLHQLPAAMGQLTSLRTLTNYIVGDEDGRRIGELKSLNLGGFLCLKNLNNVRDAADAKEVNLSSKQNLRSLQLRWNINHYEDVLHEKKDEEVLEALRPPGDFKVLDIRGYGGGSFPVWMYSLLLKNLVEIDLRHCRGCQHLPPLWKLPFLECLYLSNMDKIKHICSSTIYDDASNGTVLFPSLKKMVLDTMQSLEKGTDYVGTAEVKLVFPHVAELEITDCPNLMTMPELPSLKSLKMMGGTNKQLGLVCSLTTLSSLEIDIYKMSNGTESPPLAQKKMWFRNFRSPENLTIRGSEDLAPLLEEEEEEEETRGLSSSLHDLSFFKCNGLFSSSQQSSSPLGFWKNLASLLFLGIYDCDDLVYWPEEEFRGLNSLKKLDIMGCPKLVGPSRDGELLPNLEELYIIFCNSLQELPKLPASLRSLQVYGCPKMNSLTEGLRHATALNRIIIGYCSSLTSLPSQLADLTELKSLSISNCKNLSHLPEGMQGLTALQDLQIGYCENLSHLPEGMQGLTALQGLYISECPRLSSLPEGLQQRLPNLQSLRIRECPNLERQYERGGPYWDLISCIPDTGTLSVGRSNFSTFLPFFSCSGRPSTV